VNNPNLFEGDMLLDPEVKKIALAGGDISMATAGRKRGATKLHIWPSGRIPYAIEPSVPSSKFLPWFVPLRYTFSVSYKPCSKTN
jgi:hypothetical protein